MIWLLFLKNDTLPAALRIDSGDRDRSRDTRWAASAVFQVSNDGGLGGGTEETTRRGSAV